MPTLFFLHRSKTILATRRMNMKMRRNMVVVVVDVVVVMLIQSGRRMGWIHNGRPKWKHGGWNPRNEQGRRI